MTWTRSCILLLTVVYNTNPPLLEIVTGHLDVLRRTETVHLIQSSSLDLQHPLVERQLPLERIGDILPLAPAVPFARI